MQKYCFTQKEALESRIDLVETKMKQLDGKINIYKALGEDGNRCRIERPKT